MKKILAIAAAMLLTLSAFAQNGKSIYNKYSDAKNVSAVYVSPAMFRLMGKLPDMAISGDNVNLTQLVKSLEGLYLIDSENKDINADMKRDVEKFVRSGNYEVLMEVKDDGEVVHIYTTGKGDDLTGFVFLADDGKECTFICLDGKMSRRLLEDAIAEAMN